MIRKLKALGLALVAMLAVGVFTASAAIATEHEHEFHSDGTATDLTGAGTGIFTIAGFTITCSNAKFVGTQTGETADHVRVHPTYNNTENTCESSIANATVHTEGCDYTFDSDTDTNKHAAVEVVCNPGSEITITSAGCVIHVPAQKTTGGVAYDNEINKNGKKDVKVTATVTGITAVGTHSFGCTIAGKVGHLTNGTYSETATVTGYKHNSPHNTADETDIWVE